MIAPPARGRSYAMLVAVVAALFAVGIAIPYLVGDPVPTNSAALRTSTGEGSGS